ncbi:WD40 repeat domain-containing protein [Thalassoroseus pseudoceratinae]|uniref:WD40 repeat domain-containing protein n=1 Tax=Thalassoroseus pseudoceratinae TaxID=2713176 RepID=UPI0014207B33|nr:WD40 repeat domain-containing protein [Thalassoroseus pseudoceratinae]
MRCFVTLVTLVTLGTSLLAQEGPKADPLVKPILRMNSDSPYLAINAMRFDQNGQDLHAVGWNKRVQTWNWDAVAQSISADPQDLLEVPIGPGRQGNLNAIAISPSGRWVAVGGRSFGQHESAYDNDGLMWPAAAQSDEQLEAQGVIFAHDRQTGRTLRLKGTRGEVLSLEFVNQGREDALRLVSLALEFDRQETEFAGTLRLWNVQDSECIAVNESLPTFQKQPPFQMAVFNNGRRGVTKVAVTWGDHTVRVWNTANNQITKHQLVNAYGIATLPTGELVTSTQGALGTWTAADGFASKVALPDGRAPIEVQTFRSNGKTYVFAVCFHRSGQLQMVLVDATQPQWKIASDFVSIGSLSARPSCAVSGKSDVIAVAPNGDDTVRMFLLADLLRNRNEPHQVLKSSVVRHSSVEFIRKDGDLGLRLRSEDPDGSGDGILSWTFDFNLTNGFTVPGPKDDPNNDQPVVDDWDSASAAPKGWQVAQTEPAKVVVTSPDNESATVAWPDSLKMTAHAFVPPIDNQPALLAVAFNRLGEPVLNIYNAETGERVRRFFGHSALIQGLSFEENGQLLASVADDRTTRVWSLRDLSETIGKLGLLPGVVATMRDGTLVIDRFESTTPEEIKTVLQEDDVIEHAVVHGKDRTFPTAQHFYWLVSRLKPGTQLTLSIRRGDNAGQQKTVTVGQAVDERKPLFSLLFGRNANAELESRPWIGWSPVGPFESNNQEFEELVGWHFNTQNADQPADFVPIAQYRPKFYGTGLFKALIENDGPPDIWPPKPEISAGDIFFIGPDGDLLPSGSHGHVAIPEGETNVVFDLPNVDPRRVRSFGLYSGKKRLGEFKPSKTMTGAWEAKFDAAKLGSGPTVISGRPEIEGDPNPIRVGRAGIPRRKPVPGDPPPLELSPEMPKIRIEVAEALRAIIAGDQPSAVPVQVRFDKPAPVAFDVQFENAGEPILKNGKALRKTANKDKTTLAQEVPLQAGSNLLTVRLIGPNGVERLSNEVEVRVLRLPSVLELSAETGTNPMATVTSRVRSELPLVHLQLRNNQDVLVDSVPQYEPDPHVKIAATEKPDEWQVSIDSVPLAEGTNQLELMIWNEDGALQNTVQTKVEWERPLPPPPRIQLQFARETTVDTYAPNFEFTVETEAKLDRVQIRNNRGAYLSLDVPLPVDNKYTFKPTLQFNQASNRVELLVVDENGSMDQREVRISVVHQAVRVVIDQLVSADRSETLTPEGDGQFLALESPPETPRWRLHGRLVLPTNADDQGRLQNKFWIKCWVNGFLQKSVPVLRQNAADGAIPFSTDFILNRESFNRIVLELPDAPDHPAILVTDCRNPETRQKLHMFLVGLNEKNGDQFIADAKRAFQVTVDQAPAFNKVIPYKPLIDQFDPSEFNSYLIEGLRRVHMQNGEEPSLDVILLYYRGIERTMHAGQFALTTRINPSNGTSAQHYESQRLARIMERAPGAHLVMLDVMRPDGRPAELWPSVAHLGVIRAIWFNPDSPENQTLFGMIGQVLPQATRIGRLVEELRSRLPIPESSLFDSQIPNELQDLVLGDEG